MKVLTHSLFKYNLEEVSLKYIFDIAKQFDFNTLGLITVKEYKEQVPVYNQDEFWLRNVLRLNDWKSDTNILIIYNAAEGNIIPITHGYYNIDAIQEQMEYWKIFFDTSEPANQDRNSYATHHDNGKNSFSASDVAFKNINQ